MTRILNIVDSVEIEIKMSVTLQKWTKEVLKWYSRELKGVKGRLH